MIEDFVVFLNFSRKMLLQAMSTSFLPNYPVISHDMLPLEMEKKHTGNEEHCKKSQ
jgi:hypothetical protein